MKPRERIKPIQNKLPRCLSLRQTFISPLAKSPPLLKTKPFKKAPEAKLKTEQPPCHKKSISNNFGSKVTKPATHGRAHTNFYLEIEPKVEVSKASSRQLNFQKQFKKTQPKQNFQGKSTFPYDSCKLGKTLVRFGSKKIFDPIYKQFLGARSPQVLKSPKPSRENIVINNNIHIKIDYHQKPRETVLSPSNFSQPHMKKLDFFSQKKRDSGPPFAQISMANANSPRLRESSKKKEPKKIQDNLEKLLLDLKLNEKDKEIPKQVNSSRVVKKTHSRSKTQLYSPAMVSPVNFVQKNNNRRSMANLIERPKSPVQIGQNKFSFQEAFKKQKTSRHKKNALSVQPASLTACVKKLKIPIRLEKNRKPALTPEPSEKRMITNQNITKDDPSSASKNQNIYSSNRQISGNFSLKSYSKNLNIEIPEQDESESANVSATKNSNGFKMTDSIVIHEDQSIKNLLIESIRQYTFKTGKIKPTNLDFYRVIKPLGEGSYGKVYLGLSVLCELPVAIKCYDRAKIKSDSTCKRILQEIEILKFLNHPNIIKFFEIFENDKYIFMVLEYADKDDMFKFLKKNGKFKEHDFIPILAQILNGLHYLHSQHILHRDIKLDNILFNSEGQVKICDFGVSRRMNHKGLIHEHIGTPAYLAPEIVSGNGYSGFKADIWSLGVLSYIALFGNVPFKGDIIEDLNNNILNTDPVFPKNHNVSEQMVFVISRMLEKNPKKRLSLLQIAEQLDITLVDYDQSTMRSVSSDRLADLKSFGFGESQILTSLRSCEVNHITALKAIFSLQENN